MVDGAWCMVDGAWCMVDGAWCMVDGAWCMVDGAWCMVNGAWCMVDGAWCMVDGAWCMVDGAWCMVDGAWCMVDGAWCMVDGAWCMVDGAWCMVDGAWCMVDGAWCMVDGAWCMVDGAWFSSLFQNCMNGISTAPFGVNPHFLPSSSLYFPDAYVALNDSLASADVDTMQPIATRPDGVPYGFQVAKANEKANEKVFPVIFDINLDNEAATQRLQYLADSFFIDNATQSVSVAMLTYNGASWHGVGVSRLGCRAMPTPQWRLQYLADSFFIDNAMQSVSVAMLTYNGASCHAQWVVVVRVPCHAHTHNGTMFSAPQHRGTCRIDNATQSIGGKIAVTYNVDPVDVELYSSSADWARLTVTVLYVCAVVWNLIEELVEAFQCWLETGRVSGLSGFFAGVGGVEGLGAPDGDGAVVWNLIKELVEAFQCWLETGRVSE
ncbi:unnamed protein product [Closterium sp. Naga37s-1]|nr:unnamed protein product [Closterium sp. Naga37s-1]